MPKPSPRQCQNLRAVSAIVGVRAQVIYGNTNWSPKETLGVGGDYLTVRNWDLRLGRILLRPRHQFGQQGVA